MWSWRKKTADAAAESGWRGTARAALAGAPREEILREAMHTLAADGHAERIGIWLEPESRPAADGLAVETLRGLVWEQHEAPTPAEWEKLSLEAPVPHELLLAGQSVEQEVDDANGCAVCGTLIGLHHLLWTPIHGKDRLLMGTPRRPGHLPKELAEAIAAEVALALELEQTQRLARERQSDLRLSKQILAALASGISTDTILSQLAANSTELCVDHGGPNAMFVVIGHLPAAAPGAAEAPEMEFAWESGDTTWTHGVDREPLAGIWKRALETGRVAGLEPPASWSNAGLARLVALPLVGASEKLGVLVAGIPQRFSTLNTLERLELRATLAACALERRRRTGERLRRVARRKALLEASPEPTLLIASTGAVVAANGAARRLLDEAAAEPADGATHEAPRERATDESTWYTGGHLAKLFCAREQPRVEAWLQGVLRSDHASGESTPAGEAELLTGVRVRVQAPLAVGDELAALVLAPAVAHETAQLRNRAEAELHHLLEWVEEGILLFAANQTIRGMNTRFAQMAGLSAEEAAACATLDNLVDLLARRAAQPEAFASRWRELARSTESGTREEVQLARPVPRVLERSVRPVLDSAGHRLGRLEIYRDLTAQRVFQAKLLQTEKLAALGQMITGVAHELSNPLTSILGYAQRLLVRKDLAGRTMEAHQIYQEAERASAILRQLLLTARESHPERKRVSLNQVVQKALELQRFSSATEKICIELDLDPTLPFVLGDAGQLQQVLMNLMGNARQAITGQGKPGTIRLRTARIGTHRVQLQVIDDGPGIPEALLPRIFDPFFTTKPAGVGTGLGLSIVLSVTREHGGQVHASNPPAGGATFTVELPALAEIAGTSAPFAERAQEPALRATAAAPRPRARPHAAELPLVRASHRGTRVLVVEDEPTVARLIADVLEDEGMHVDVLLDGREALERTTRESYDLVICDMKMPGIDGPHFYRSLLQARSPLQKRFLFVTGDVLAPQTQEFLEENRIPHVAKPFRVEELTARVNSLLDDGQVSGTGRAAAARKAH